MKKKLLAALLLSTLSVSTVYAQSRPGSVGTIASVGNFLVNRFHTLDVGAIMDDMEKDGVKQRKLNLVLTVQGALVYNHELVGDDIQDGRDIGLQLIPFVAKIVDNQLYIQFSAASLRNMNQYNAGSYSGLGDDGGFFKVMDNVKLATFIFDRNYTNKDIDQYKAEFVGADAKFDILGAKKEERYLAVKIGGGFGYHITKYTAHNDKPSFQGEFGELRGGLEYSDSWGKNRLTIGVNGTMTEYNDGRGHYISPEDKIKYAPELAQLPENDPKRDKIGAYSKIVRNSFYVAPSVEFSTRINPKSDKPVRIGFKVQGNIPVQDKIENKDLNVDLSKTNREVVRGGVFINF